jgi:hypothetical protein
MFRTTSYWDNPRLKNRPTQRHNFGGSGSVDENGRCRFRGSRNGRSSFKGSGRSIEIERPNFRRSVKENERLSSDR